MLTSVQINAGHFAVEAENVEASLRESGMTISDTGRFVAVVGQLKQKLHSHVHGSNLGMWPRNGQLSLRS